MGGEGRGRVYVHFGKGHPVCFVGPAGGDAAVAGVEMVFVYAGAVGDEVRGIGYRGWDLALSTG